MDGSGDFVDVPDSASLDITQAITLDAWINATTFALPIIPGQTQDPNIYVISKDTSGSRSYGIGVTDYDPLPPTGCGPGGAHAFMIAFTNGGIASICSSTVLNPNTWYHLTGTYDSATGKAKIYVNGLFEAERTVLPGSTITSGSANVQIGARQYPGYRAYFNGLIDEAEIFSGALSGDEIARIYNARASGKCRLKVDIDIKPGSYPNSINLGSAGVIPVAILTSSTFDATQVDPLMIDFAGASVKLVGKKDLKPLCHAEDANADTLDDLVCQVYTEELILDTGAANAVLKGKTYDSYLGGIWIWGEDSVNIVQPQ